MAKPTLLGHFADVSPSRSPEGLIRRSDNLSSFRVLILMLLLICSWCKFCSKVKVYFSTRVA